MFDAIESGNHNALQELILAEADINFDEKGKTALHKAIIVGNIQALRLLIEAGANCEIREETYNWTPLMQAAHYAQIEAVKILLQAKANVNAKRPDSSMTVLML